MMLCSPVEAAGGHALPCVVDVRDEESVAASVEQAVAQFGGIDILVNNASAISLTGTQHTSMKKYDLMHQINTRGTYLVWVATLVFKDLQLMILLQLAMVATCNYS